ncbi:rCG44764 [Rattus norvegicus]|uniref:RCG44764 n=1 Tax=Rattus norvegicus TaxID=10116 RepID=A6I555_RAT|nr:rCG44764 [Rattus norvegicus]
MGTHETAVWVKELGTKPDRLSLIPRTCTVEGENHRLSSDLQVH